jgi:hypothetical protein
MYLTNGTVASWVYFATREYMVRLNSTNASVGRPAYSGEQV